MNRRVDDLLYQLNVLHEELRAYEGVRENLGDLRRRLDRALEENNNLKREKEIRLLDESARDVFLKRALHIDALAQNNEVVRLHLEERDAKDGGVTCNKLNAENDLLRAKVIEQNLHIQHLKDMLGLLSHQRSQADGDRE